MSLATIHAPNDCSSRALRLTACRRRRFGGRGSRKVLLASGLMACAYGLLCQVSSLGPDCGGMHYVLLGLALLGIHVLLTLATSFAVCEQGIEVRRLGATRAYAWAEIGRLVVKRDPEGKRIDYWEVQGNDGRELFTIYRTTPGARRLVRVIAGSIRGRIATHLRGRRWRRMGN